MLDDNLIGNITSSVRHAITELEGLLSDDYDEDRVKCALEAAQARLFYVWELLDCADGAPPPGEATQP